MPRCVAIDSNGFVVDVIPQPSDVSTCTLVLASPSELESPVTGLFNLTADQGGSLVILILGTWLIGWGIAQAVRLGSSSND